MDAVATVLAGFIVFSAPLLWWLTHKAQDRYSRDLEDIKSLVNERSRSIESLQGRLDKLHAESDEPTKSPSRRSYFYTASGPSAMNQRRIAALHSLKYDALEEYFSLYPTGSQDWRGAMRKPTVSSVAPAPWSRLQSGRIMGLNQATGIDRVMVMAWGDFQSSGLRGGQNAMESRTFPERDRTYNPFMKRTNAHTG